MAKKGTQKTGCGKPHHAYGSRRKKKEFSGKMCASATFHHLFYALMCIMGFNVDHSHKKKTKGHTKGNQNKKENLCEKSYSLLYPLLPASPLSTPIAVLALFYS